MSVPLPIRVAFAEDHALMQTYIRDLLTTDLRLKVVAEATTGTDLIRVCLRDPPDIILLDLHMPGLGAVDIVQTLCREVPQSPILMVTSEDDDVFVLAMARLGVRGYIVKHRMDDDLIPGIHAVLGGALWYAPGFDIG